MKNSQIELFYARFHVCVIKGNGNWGLDIKRSMNKLRHIYNFIHLGIYP